jgi:uncharacterized membrane protein YphA (DoxX/SURF4 family)
MDEILKNFPVLATALLIAILFIQSGLDKVFDWTGNLGWLTGHFSKTPLAPMVPFLLAVITVMEVATGLLALAGVIYFLATGSTVVIFWSGVLGAMSVIALFFGQRIAKDYAGAAVLVPYFLLLLALIYLANPFPKA